MAAVYEFVLFAVLFIHKANIAVCQELAVLYPSSSCPVQPSTSYLQYFNIMRMRCLPCSNQDSTTVDQSGEYAGLILLSMCSTCTLRSVCSPPFVQKVDALSVL